MAAGVTLCPQDLFHQMYLIALQEKDGDLDGAADACCKALALAPNSEQAYETLIDIFKKRNEIKGAIAVLDKLQQEFPGIICPYYYLAVCLDEKGDKDAAIAACRRAAAVESADGAMLAKAGTWLADHGDFPNAIPPFRRALKAKNDLVSAHWGLLRALCETKDFEAARAEAAEFKRLNLAVPEDLVQKIGADTGTGLPASN